MNPNYLINIFTEDESGNCCATLVKRIYSIKVTNSDSAKHITFSKTLSCRLGLEDTVSFLPVTSRGILLVAKTLPDKKAISARVNRDAPRKIIYNSNLVKLITNVFDLDFRRSSSKSFTDITFDEHEGIPIAIIKVAEPIRGADDND